MQKIVLILLACITVILAPIANLLQWWELYIFLFLLLSAFFWRFNKEYFSGNWFNPMFFFIISYFAVFIYVPGCSLWGLVLPNKFIRYLDFDFLAGSIVYAVLGFAMFLLGYMSFSFRLPVQNVLYMEEARQSIDEKKFCAIFNILLLFGLIVYGVFVYHAGRSFVLEHQYVDNMFNNQAQRFLSLHNTVLYCVMGLTGVWVFVKKPTDLTGFLRVIPLRVWIYLFFVNILFVLNGDRGFYLPTVLALIMIYTNIVKPMSCKKFFLCCLILGVAMTGVGILREEETKFGFNLESMPVNDLAFTYQTWNLSLSLFPEVEDFHGGRNLKVSALRLVPVISTFVDLQKNTDNSSSLFFTEKLLKNSYGTGTTSLSDLWIDFGVWGIVVGSYLLGLLYGWTCLYPRKNIYGNAIWIVGICYWSFNSLYVHRSVPLEMIRPFLTVVLFSVVTIYFSRRQGERRHVA